MIGKLIVHGRDRETAVARMRQAPPKVVIEGVRQPAAEDAPFLPTRFSQAAA